MRTDEREPYQLYQIKFTQDQVIWLLGILPLLHNGWWPESEDCQGGSHSRRAYFQTPVEIAIELDARLEKTGIDGAMAEGHYCLLKSYESLAKQYRRDEEIVISRIERAIDYMSGEKRKRFSYQAFKNRRGWTKVAV